jgi:hypothetical protein
MNWHALDKNIDDRIEEKKLRGFGGVGDNEHIEVEKEVSLIRDSHPLAILWDFLIFSLTIFHTYDIAFKYAFLTSTPGRSATFSRNFPQLLTSLEVVYGLDVLRNFLRDTPARPQTKQETSVRELLRATAIRYLR